MEAKSNWTFKTGLFLVVLFWFSFTIYQLGKATYNGIDIAFTDVPAAIGLGFRVAAGFIALITLLFYMVKRDMSPLEALTSMRWIVLLEAVYWFSLFPSAIWGFQTSFPMYPRELFIIGTGVPCLAESIVMPVALGALFLKLSAKKPARGAIKWGLIAGTGYIFVLWLNYTAQWWSDMILSGIDFISLHPLNAFGFALTAGGLLLLTLYSGVYSKRSFGTDVLTGLNLKKAGAIIIALGLYFDVLILSWLLFGNPSEGSISYTFFMFHNMDLWLLSLPLVGLPLALYEKRDA
jgi:hypothetical protein